MPETSERSWEADVGLWKNKNKDAGAADGNDTDAQSITDQPTEDDAMSGQADDGQFRDVPGIDESSRPGQFGLPPLPASQDPPPSADHPDAPPPADGPPVGTVHGHDLRLTRPVDDSPARTGPLAPGNARTTAPAPPTRPNISLPAQPGSDDEQASGPRTFPKPLVIGAVPALRSEPRGLPNPDEPPGPVLPDSVLDGADFDGLLIRGASLRGDRHRYEATVRQDSMGIWRLGDSDTEAVLVCVTDGVSSEPLSHRGAAEACRLLRDAIALDVSALLKAQLKRRVVPVWDNIVGEICNRLTAVAGYLGVAPRALSTTLAAALIELNPHDVARRRFVVLNVGDATAFLLSEREFIPLLADPHDTTITSTATYALPTSIGEVGADVGVMGPGDMLMVCTDGMSNPMRNDDVCAQLLNWWCDGPVPSMPEFGWQMSYRVKTYDDDRTAVCVWGL